MRLLVYCLLILRINRARSFSPCNVPFSVPTLRRSTRCQPPRTTARIPIQLYQAFDISKPVFDLYARRTVRGDALAKYNSLNQSEPLRINLFALLSVTLLCSPWIVQELTAERMSTVQIAVGIGGGVGFTLLFLRECQKRSNQLLRLEKELFALDLTIRLPAAQIADAPFRKTITIRESMAKRSIRVLVIAGHKCRLQKCLQQLQVLGRRLVQANAYVVAIPTDGLSLKDLVGGNRYPWLASPGSLTEWKAYVDGLSSDDEFKWFGLSASGRSFGSGRDDPSWLQLLGQHLRPIVLLDALDPSQPDREGVLLQQSQFYKALTTGQLDMMSKIYSSEKDPEMTSIIEQGGRLEDWTACLEDAARPVGMNVADQDVTIISDTKAFSTCVECPAMIDGATLLAVQEWTRTDASSNWELVRHQTIPWAEQSAAGTLICDCRGCVSLIRNQGRRTFGGIIG
jgi:hypothetical protein